MNKLNKIKIKGFKSIREAEIDLKPLNILIGANGAGKSNFVSFMYFLNYMMSGNLRFFIGREGGGNALLFYGVKTTKELECEFNFETNAGYNLYRMRLVSAAHDQLIFADEQIAFTKHGSTNIMNPISLGAGHRETMLFSEELPSVNIRKTAKVIGNIISQWRVYQFHDTSKESNIRTNSPIADNRYLRDDAGNLASFLYRLKHQEPQYYRRIVTTISQVAPFFDDFVLEPTVENKNMIALEWKEKKSDMVFSVNQLSDGTIRMMGLITLLLQPNLPPVICIDEPELGLHPYAIHVLASLLKMASQKSQIVVATQSVSLVDNFDPEDIVVVNRNDRQTTFERLNDDKLEDWLKDYTISELWQKNVLGGRPSQ